MMITCLTTNCNTVVLDKCVFIIMDDIKYEFKNKYQNMKFDGFVELLRVITIKDKHKEAKHDRIIISMNIVDLFIDNTRRMCFTSEKEFVINDALYYVKMITRMYLITLLLKGKYDEVRNEYKIQALSMT